MYFNFHTHHSNNVKEEIVNVEELNNDFKGYFSYGIHPFSDKKVLDEALFQHPNCLAVGETGLDKLSNKPFDLQFELFRKHIECSEKYQLPLILHCVKSWNEVKQLKKEIKPKQKWIFHGFRKNNILSDVLKQDLLIGIGPAILFDTKLQNSILNVSLSSILIETDDKIIDIAEIYSKIANIFDVSIDEISNVISNNFRKVFKV
jgi:TatD DNase family protein